MDFLLLQTMQTRSGANSAFYSLGTVGSSPKTTAVQLITELHLALRYRMNAAISPLPHMPSWCAQGQRYVYCFTFTDSWPSSQFQFHTSSQFTTADLILMCYCIQMRLSFMKKQFCESGRYILSIMMLQSHYSWHLTWTDPYRGQSKVCTITVHCGSLLWPTVSETDFIWPHTLNFCGWKVTLHMQRQLWLWRAQESCWGLNRVI